MPVVSKLAEAPQANTLLIGIAPPGGKIPTAWRPVVLEAIERGMDVVSGLHDFLVDDDEFAAAAQRSGVKLIDVRRNKKKRLLAGKGCATTASGSTPWATTAASARWSPRSRSATN